jgi:hypothetical protein
MPEIEVDEDFIKHHPGSLAPSSVLARAPKLKTTLVVGVQRTG